MNTQAPSFLIGSSSLLQATRTTIMSQMSSKFGQAQPWTAELAALDQLKFFFSYLRTIQNTLMTCWISDERSLPFGPLVCVFVLRLKVPVNNVSVMSGRALSV